MLKKCGVCPAVSGESTLIVAMFGTAEQGFTKYYRCTAHQHVPPTENELKQVVVSRLTLIVDSEEKCYAQ